MSTRWEYLQVIWSSTTNFVTKKLDEFATVKEVYQILRPGKEPEDLGSDLNWLSLLNELGADGWELVAERMQSSVVASQMYGWPDVGTPILMVWTFKRPGRSSRA